MKIEHTFYLWPFWIHKATCIRFFLSFSCFMSKYDVHYCAITVHSKNATCILVDWFALINAHSMVLPTQYKIQEYWFYLMMSIPFGICLSVIKWILTRANQEWYTDWESDKFSEFQTWKNDEYPLHCLSINNIWLYIENTKANLHCNFMECL